MLSIVVPANDEIARTRSLLTEEYGTATNIKSRVNRQSVLSAITVAQQRLKRYDIRAPKNGLVLYTGLVSGKMMTIDFEPPKAINTSLYMCDDRFHTEVLSTLLSNDATYGFIVVDGNGALFGTLSGAARRILQHFRVDLPKKHGRGGQSALRFDRIRVEKRHNYLRRVTELAAAHFITDNGLNVAKLILAGAADFKTELSQTAMFDPRLKAATMAVVDVGYGGESGFVQAIELCGPLLSDVKLVHEKEILARFFEEISKSNRWAIGTDDVMQALAAGAVETCIVWEDLATVYGDMPLSEWLVDHWAEFGCKLEIVSDKSPQGTQFVRGLGGLGAILRYSVDSVESVDSVDNVESFESFDE